MFPRWGGRIQVKGGCESGDDGEGAVSRPRLLPALRIFTSAWGGSGGAPRLLAIAGWDTYLTVTNILLFSQNYLKIVFEHEDAH